MATNSFGNVFATVFGKLDSNLKHLVVFMKLRGTEAHNVLKKGGMGKKYTYDSMEEGKARRNTRGAANKIQTFTPTAAVLDVNQDFEYSFTQNDFDATLYQNAGDFIARQYESAEKQLHRAMDGDFLGEVLKFNNVFDKKEVTGAGGDAGVGIDLTDAATLPRRVLAKAKAFIATAAGSYEKMSHVVSPDILAEFEEVAVASGFNYADSVLKNGFLGTSMQGVDFYVSQYVTHSLQFDFAGLPANNGTLVLAGVTFTGVTGTPSAAGEFKIETDADTTITNFANLFNDPATTIAGKGIAVGTSDSDEVADLEGYSAENDGSDALVITSKRGRIAYTEALTNVTAEATQKAKCLFGRPGDIEMANPIAVKPFVRPGSTNSDVNYFVEAAWGVQVPFVKRDEGGYVVYAV